MKPIPPHGRRTLTLPITKNRSVEERTGRPGAGTGRTPLRSAPRAVPGADPPRRRAAGAGSRAAAELRDAPCCPLPSADGSADPR